VLLSVTEAVHQQTEDILRDRILYLPKKQKMDWIQLTDLCLLEEIKTKSFQQAQIILKHSTTCSISAMAKNRIEKGKKSSNFDFYYLDLLKFRNISNEIATIFQVHHESPQVLIIKNGECVYSESHYAINLEEIIEQAEV
jgi:bacillithiol system protein YtxJ